MLRKDILLLYWWGRVKAEGRPEDTGKRNLRDGGGCICEAGWRVIEPRWQVEFRPHSSSQHVHGNFVTKQWRIGAPKLHSHVGLDMNVEWSVGFTPLSWNMLATGNQVKAEATAMWKIPQLFQHEAGAWLTIAESLNPHSLYHKKSLNPKSIYAPLPFSGTSSRPCHYF